MVEKPTVTTDTTPHEAVDKADASPVVRSRAQNQETSNTSYSSYLFGRAGESDKPLWSDSTKGRATIRLISRGIVGAIAMTAVDRISRNQLLNYTPESIKGWTGEHGWWQANMSQKIAKGYDTVFGKPIQAFVHAVAPAGKTAEGVLLKDAYSHNATQFRYKTYYHTQPGQMPGHSLGAEIVQVTASFAAGSLGDAGTRNIIQVFDPNNVKVWMVNDKGDPAKAGEKKHFSFDKWAKSTLRTTWRVVSKNMGEDWAVALPYVYQMRWQRGLLANHFPDSKLVLDNSLNGGSMLVNKQGQLIGDFQLPGAIDLHSRFVGYNWYTLMYREAYDAVGRQFGKWADSGYSLKPHLPTNPIAAVVDNVGYSARYVVKSFIKANLYMNPAVVPFWAVRVSQSKWRAPVIVEKQDGFNAFAQRHHLDGQSEHVGADAFGNHRYKHDTMKDAFIPGRDKGGMFAEGSNKRLSTSMYEGSKAYSWETTKALIHANPVKGLFSAAIAPFGWASFHAGSAATKLGEILPEGGRIGRLLNNGAVGQAGAWQRQSFMRNMVDNSFSYTPYMIAKAETALRVDERPANGGLGAMDKAIYKFIDSSVRFDLKGAGKAIKEIGSNAVDMGREVKMREGGEVTVGQLNTPTPLTPEDKPTNRVHTKTVHRDPNARERASDKVANDNEHIANDNEHDKNWAESVTGRALDGRFMSGPQSIH